MQKYQDVVLNQNGNPIAGAQITVTDLLGTPVAVYSSNAIGLDVNPLTSGTDGHFSFYAPDGRYSLVVRFGGTIVSSVTDILLEDPMDGSDAVFNNVTILGALSGASKVSISPTGNVAATNVQDAIAELDSEKSGAAALAATSGATLVGSDDGASGSLWTTVAGFIAFLLSNLGASVIGFIQAGAGAVKRSVQDPLRELPGIADYTTGAQAIAAWPSTALRVPVGTHDVTDLQLSSTGLVGLGAGSVLKAGGTSSAALVLGYTSTPGLWVKKRVAELLIDGNAKASNGVTFGATTSTQLSGRWVLDTVYIKDCLAGVRKEYGNIGNAISDSQIVSNDYGYFAKGVTSPIMHAGADYIVRTHFENNARAAIYIDSPTTGTGGTSIRDTIIENNPGFGVFVKSWVTGYTPLTFDNLWFENNATSASVDVEGVSYTPVDMYLENTVQAVITNGMVPKLKLVNSNLIVENSLLQSGVTTWDIDSTSTAIVKNAHITGGVHPVVIDSVARISQVLGTQVSRFLSPVRAPSWDSGNVLLAESYAGRATYTFAGTGNVNATKVADGRSFESCAELVVPASYTLVGSSFTTTTDKWYVVTIDVKHVAGTLSQLTFDIVNGGTAANGLRALLTTGKWANVAFIGRASGSFTARLQFVNGAAGTQTLRLSGYQVMEFDTQRDALEYYNSGVVRVGLTLPRTIFQQSAPTTGTWSVGDVCVNTSKVVGQPKSWSCTVAGAPGTWVSDGNL